MCKELCVAGLPRNTKNTPGVKTGTTTCRFDTQLFLIFIVSPSTSSVYEEMDDEAEEEVVGSPTPWRGRRSMRESGGFCFFSAAQWSAAAASEAASPPSPPPPPVLAHAAGVAAAAPAADDKRTHQETLYWLWYYGESDKEQSPAVIYEGSLKGL